MRRIRLVTLPALLLATAMWLPGDALAEEIPEGIAWDGSVGMYLDSEGDASLLLLSPLLGVRASVGERLLLRGDWGFSYLGISGEGDSQTSFIVGNPFVAAYYRFVGNGAEMAIGGGVGLPIANVDVSGIETLGDAADALTDVLNYGLAAGIRGNRELWLWTPDTLPIVVDYMVDREMGVVTIGNDTAFAFYVPIGDNEGDTDVALHSSSNIEANFGLVRLGGRILITAILTVEDDLDGTQIALEPFVGLDLGIFALDVALTMNIDDPLGFAFDDDGVWGLHFGFGG